MLIMLLGAVFLAHFFWLLAGFAAVVVVGRLFGGWLARRDDQAVAARRRDAETCARADQQHVLVLAGDDRGVYGIYPPVRPYVDFGDGRRIVY